MLRSCLRPLWWAAVDRPHKFDLFVRENGVTIIAHKDRPLPRSGIYQSPKSAGRDPDRLTVHVVQLFQGQRFVIIRFLLGAERRNSKVNGVNLFPDYTEDKTICVIKALFMVFG